MYQLKDATSFYTKPYILFDLIYNGKLTVEDAISITNNQDKLLKEIIKIVSNSNDYIGKNDIEKELSYLSLRFIRSINDKINEPESERFKSAESLTPDELYYVMTYGRLEVLASTFNGVYDLSLIHI